MINYYDEQELKIRFFPLFSDILQKAFGVGLMNAGTLHEC